MSDRSAAASIKKPLFNHSHSVTVKEMWQAVSRGCSVREAVTVSQCRLLNGLLVGQEALAAQPHFSLSLTCLQTWFGWQIWSFLICLPPRSSLSTCTLAVERNWTEKRMNQFKRWYCADYSVERVFNSQTILNFSSLTLSIMEIYSATF